VARSKSLLDFNTKAGPPEPSTSSEAGTNSNNGPLSWGQTTLNMNVADFVEQRMKE
jgi:hypothetical protein